MAGTREALGSIPSTGKTNKLQNLIPGQFSIKHEGKIKTHPERQELNIPARTFCRKPLKNEGPVKTVEDMGTRDRVFYSKVTIKAPGIRVWKLACDPSSLGGWGRTASLRVAGQLSNLVRSSQKKKKKGWSSGQRLQVQPPELKTVTYEEDFKGHTPKL